MTQRDNLAEERKSEIESDRTAAYRIHDINLNFAQNTNNSTAEAGRSSLKALLLINGGAAITILAFVGNLFDRGEGTNTARLLDLILSLQWFGWGVALSTAAAGLTYFANYTGTLRMLTQTFSLEAPYVSANKASNRWKWVSLVITLFAMATSIASLVAFLIGMARVRDAILAGPIG